MPILHQCLLWTIAAGLVLSASPASGLASPIVRRMSKSLRHCNITLNGEGGRPFTHRFAKDEILLPVEAKWISQYITMMERGFAGIFQKVTDGCLTDHKDKVVLDIGASTRFIAAFTSPQFSPYVMQKHLFDHDHLRRSWNLWYLGCLQRLPSSPL